MVAFLAGWFALSLVTGALWALAASRGLRFISEPGYVTDGVAGARVVPLVREPARLRQPA